jgi:uncharacterized C2H2 Zn-finger protein
MPDGDRLDLPRTGRSQPPRSERSPRSEALTERLFFCPDCGAALSEREQPQHLVVAHGYIPVSGTLLSPGAALSCLWDRVFNTGDLPAHEQLLRLLEAHPDRGADPSPYVTALQTELQGRADTLLSLRPQHRGRIVQNLRASSKARDYFDKLLVADDLRVRELGRELLLPDAGAALASARTSVAEVRSWLEKLCPREDVWCKIRVCQRLPRFGVAGDPARECLRQLQGERPVACPECGAAVLQNEVEIHLRREHRINQFRGEHRSERDTIVALLAALCSVNPDPAAWEILEAIAHDQNVKAGTFLANHVVHALQGLREEVRGEVLAAMTEVIAASSSGPSVLLALAQRHGRWARQLALVLTERLPQPLSDEVIGAVRPLLARKRAPRPTQIAAAAALLRTTGTEGARAKKVINSLISRCGKARALDRLRRLGPLVGPSAMIAERCRDIEGRMRMRCPRCQIQLRRPDMETHLWTEHGLVLDGERVREPWRLMRTWLDNYRRTGDAELLVRCRSLAQHLDSEQGLQRVHRLMLVSGVEDVEARQILLAKAKQRGESLCPHCYALVPVPEEVLPRMLNESRGRLSLSGYCVQVSERGLVPRLTMETPSTVIYRGREPGCWLTRQAALLLFAGPPALAALVIAIFHKFLQSDTKWPALLSLLAVLLYLMVRMRWWRWPKPIDRAVDYAWTMFVPKLHAGRFSVEDSAFLAGLALTSLHHGRAGVRADNLKRVVHYTENALLTANKPAGHLAALKRLEVTDDAAAGKDPVPPVVLSVAQCFTRGRPLTFAQHLLGEWEGSWWTSGNLARLRVLLCDRAFEAGLEVLDLVEVGHSAPALAAVLQTEAADRLAQLRLLWSLRPRRPWERWGDPVTVFELANSADVGRKLLAKHPDLLLMDESVPDMFLCGRGILFHDVLFTEMPRKIDMRARKDFGHTEYEIAVGTQRFPVLDDQSQLVGRLERWFHYYFEEFAPQVDAVYSWHAPEKRPVQFQEAVECPECGQPLVAVRGDVGLALPAKDG